VVRAKTKETRKHKPATRNGNGANPGFEVQLLLAANMEEAARLVSEPLISMLAGEPWQGESLPSGLSTAP